MTNITTIIDQESGIQYQGVNDASGGTGTYPVIGLIVGQFRRGRFDKPMTITNENIKAQLGYDPTNPHYMAVKDVLSANVASVQVLRVGQTSEVYGATRVQLSYTFLTVLPAGTYNLAVEITENGVTTKKEASTTIGETNPSADFLWDSYFAEELGLQKLIDNQWHSLAYLDFLESDSYISGVDNTMTDKFIFKESRSVSIRFVESSSAVGTDLLSIFFSSNYPSKAFKSEGYGARI